MSTFIKTDGVFPVSAGPILQADPVINDGTLWCYDLLDPASWPSQAAPTAGATVADLAEVGDGVFPTGNGMSWSNGVVCSLGALGYIEAPTSSDLAPDVAGFGTAVWVSFSDLSDSLASVMTMGKSGSGYDNTQYIIATMANVLSIRFCGSSSNIFALGGVSTPTLVTGQVYQLGLTVEKSGSNYIGKAWIDGVLIATATVAGPMVDALTIPAARFGAGDIFGATPGMTMYRWVGDDLSALSAAEFIAADYAARQGEF